MSTQQNPYATLQSLRASASLKEYADPMEEGSQELSKSSPDSSLEKWSEQSMPNSTSNGNQEVEVEEEEPLPPSFHCTITEETLRDNDGLYVFWANIRIPIPKNPDNPVSSMFEHLETFVSHMLEADAHFSVFPHNLSKYESIEDLPEPIEDPNQLPGKVDEWLEYFPGARPRAWGGYTYTSALLSFREPFTKVIKETALWLHKSKFGLWKSSLQSEKPVSVGWLLFSAPTMDIEVMRGEISLRIRSIPVGLRWKMISMGAQGMIPKNQQVKALHVYMDELDVAVAKPRLSAVYMSKPAPGHFFPLHICMRLVPEIDMILNTKGRANADWLRACQNTWLAEKLVYIKAWEIELLDHYNLHVQMSLRTAMMSLSHPTNNKFVLFHSIDWHWIDKCHILTVLKSVELQARAMISGMLPYLQWKFGSNKTKKTNIAKWFKPEAKARAVDAYWDPKDKCIKNTSNLMLAEALAEDNELYWVAEKPAQEEPASLKQKWVQLEEESLDNTVSTIKSGLSTKKTCKSALKTSSTNDKSEKTNQKDMATITSQSTSISQLTEQVNEIKQSHKTFLDWFDQLAEQMAVLIAATQPHTNTPHPAGGHIGGSGRPPWQGHAV